MLNITISHEFYKKVSDLLTVTQEQISGGGPPIPCFLHHIFSFLVKNSLTKKFYDILKIRYYCFSERLYYKDKNEELKNQTNLVN